jgi:hypothetical protein
LPSSGNSSVSSPVAIRITFTALPMTSAGRFSPLGPVALIWPFWEIGQIFHPPYCILRSLSDSV